MTTPLRIRAWQLERYRLGELPQDQMSTINEALGADPESHERLDEIRADDRRVLSAHPPAVVAASLRARLDSAAPTRLPWVAKAPLFGAGLAAVCLLALLPLTRDSEPLPQTRIKGLSPSLLVFRDSPNRAEPLAPSSTAHADDVVQLAYQAAGRRYGVVVSIDGRGHVTRHLPSTGSQAARLQSGAPVALPEAYRLDDAPGFERFFLVTADAPFDVDAVVRATERLYGGNPDPARTGNRLDLPGGFDQYRFELRKEGSR